MFFKLAKFEFNYFRKQPSFYVTSLVFFLLSFFAMVSDNVQIGGSSNVNFNSPHAIAQTMLIMSLIGMFLVANFVGGTAVRDYAHKMDGMILALPISNKDYLWGRLAGSFGFCLLVFASVPLGTLIGSFWPGVDAERLGDTQLLPYIWAYIIFVIPNFFFCSTLFYIFALKFRTMMGMYLGVVGFFIFYNLSQQLLANPDYVQLASMLDPFGLGAFAETTRYWTPFELNNHIIPLEGVLLLNRVLWLSITFVILFVTHVLINVRRPSKIKAKKLKNKASVQPPKEFSLTKPVHSKSADWSRFFTRTKFEILQIIKSAPFIILCLISLFSLTSILFSTNGLFGTNNWPLTRIMTDYTIGSFGLMFLIVVTYYSAETIWRDRQLGIGDIIDSTPTKNWSLYFPKIIALTTVIVTLSLLGIIFTVIYQASKGYLNFEWDVYFSILALGILIPMIMQTLLAVFIQILSPNKYIGMLIFVAYFIGSIVLSQLGLEHHLWRFASSPPKPYSDINQFGHFLTPALWYNLYWAGLTLVLVILGFALWRRGSEFGLKYRFTMLKANAGTAGIIALFVGLSTFVGAGSYIYYNTQVLNTFISRDDSLDLQAEYEQAYKQYEKTDVPTITDVNVNVDFYPEQRKVTAKGFYLVTNKNETPLRKVLLSWDSGKNREFSFTVKGAKETDRDEDFGSTWIEFEPALNVGESTRLDFEFTRSNQGFVDAGSDTNVVANGSFLNNFDLFPHFGYNASRQISDPHERRKHDLPPADRLPKLEDSSEYGNNFIGKEADFINFETIVSTTENQVAISPGYLQKEWVENGRRYFHYKMDAPIFNFVAFLSGEYAILKDRHKDVSIDIYHHPKHNKNLDRMVDSVKASLDYFGEQFAPYQHRQVRIIEFPNYSRFAQSFANTIPYSEDIGFIADLRDDEAIDYVYFVTAHEMAHQWWGHQVTPANVQGSAVLSETLSEYSAYMVMEKHLGKDHLRKFLKWEMDRYLRGRSGEIVEEMPLYRAENQQYIHYQKGGVVMYSIRDRIGEETLNAGLRNFLKAFQFKADPYPTTLDLLQYIKAEAPTEHHAFIDDLFMKITLFDLKMKSAVATKMDNGHYNLELTVEAKKFYADGQGEETETDFSENFNIGIFSKDPDKAKGTDHILYFKNHLITKGENKITLEVNELPEYAGIDPYIKMIDRNSDDNLKKIDVNK